ncbi:MAG TPA: hypothetical protein VFB39_07660 [Solirubrobacteraceae bacterium]|nr:hypothetical protein [Solirubrobacteraceae bacterium]
MSPAPELAIRVRAIEDLFVSLDARPLAERPLREEVRLKLLDEWEPIRDGRSPTLCVHAPASERAGTDVDAVGAAVRADLRAHTRRLHYVNPLAHRERIAVWAGILIFLGTIVVSTLLDRISTYVLIVGISQGIVVIGWVALWDPAQRLFLDIIPHHFARKRYAELAEIQLRFAWRAATKPIGEAGSTADRGNSDQRPPLSGDKSALRA